MNRAPVRTYAMVERSSHLDFDIRDQSLRAPLTQPHKHEYFQIQVNLAGDTQHHVGGTVRPFTARTLSFVLPHRMHLVPHPPGTRWLVVNFSQRFLRPDLAMDPLDLEDVPLTLAPELAPFQFQEHLDFTFDEAGFAEVLALLGTMQRENAARRLASLARIRGCLLELLALTCQRWEGELLALAATQAQQGSRRAALARVLRYLRDELAGEPTLADAAEAASLSPNYLTHLIKKETGKTFTELLTERRLALAQELLLATGERIGEIARRCGFADEAYFARRFRQWHGLSPRAWRERQRQALG
ncbi:helix-turn-helix transcriptional regulator [Paenacidovorax monticola]|uniref:Helix-turn-helix transcriptional regulator n=1 Tax=Paenacidovorax monticola TaxID=1926868 RepID=A0A7H0HBT6_9BURK|nr:AraC family transcriptional regulator [Paenacidovorax monticola]QNP58002.1 helix-turn-helix transcriptional regulator [Paenacidovorax monticola]